MRQILFVSLIVFISCNNDTGNQSADVVQENVRFSRVRLTNLGDQPISIDQFKGQTIFLNFWATWCKPCIAEMPHLKNAQQILASRNVVFLFASNESSDEIEDFKNGHDYNFNYVRILNMEELGVEVLPTTYIFDSAGKLVFSEAGYRKWDDSNNIQMILKINENK